MKTLAELLANVPHTVIAGSTDVAVRSVVADSRRVQAGDVYVCLPGYRAEGGEMRADRHEFIPEALKRGATALAIEHESEAIIPPGITVIQVVDAWAAIAAMADAFYDHPSHALTVIGVTGTSGKTSTTYFIEAVLQAAGRRCARLFRPHKPLPKHPNCKVCCAMHSMSGATRWPWRCLRMPWRCNVLVRWHSTSECSPIFPRIT